MTTLPITGNVDPALLAGLAALTHGFDGVGNSSERAGHKAAESAGAWNVAKESARSAADTYNEVTAALSSIFNGVERVITRTVELATEQGRLDSMSARLGLDFDRAASAAGRFADETEAMGVAGRFAAADIHLTQTELDAMMRVAGATSEVLGTDTAGAVEQLQEALIRGREGGLQRFGDGLAQVAGSSFTVQQRLDALVAQAARTTAATDNAADRMKRFKDSLEDAQRVAASAFVNETIRIQAFGEAARGAANDTDELKNNMQALGDTGAYVLNQTANLAGVLVGGIAMILAPAINGIRAALAVVTNPAALLPGGNARGLLADLNRIQEENASINRFVGDRARGLMNGGRALDERTTADAGAGGAMDASGRARDAAARGTAAPEATGWGGSAGLATQAPVAAVGTSGSGTPRSVFATREQLAANARAYDTEQIAQAGREKAAESAQLQRRIAHGRAAVDTDRAIAEARRASHVAYEEKRNREEILFQESLAQARVDAANDNARMFAEQAAAGPNAGKVAEQERLIALERTQQIAQSEKDTLDASIARHESYAGRLAELNNERVVGAQRAAEFTSSAFDAMGKAIGTHVQALVEGRETVGVALQGMLSDTLISVGKEAVIQGGMEIAKGVAALAGVVTAPLAPGHFAAGAAFLAVGAAAGVAGAALAPSAPAAGAGAAGNGGARGALSDRASGGSDAMAPIVVNYWAPVIGGRESSDSEVGTRLDRYDDAARARMRRAA